MKSAPGRNIAAPSPVIEIPADVRTMLARFIVCEYSYYTPKGEPLCWPVTPYWYPQRGVLGISTGLAYPKKADYPKLQPKVAALFSDPTGSGLVDAPAVLLQGDATVLDADIQENTDRYVREMRRKFAAARIGLNPISVKLLDFYLPRLWVEITPTRVVVMRGGTQQVYGPPRPAPDRAHAGGALSPLTAEGLDSLSKRVTEMKEGVLAVRGADGYPSVARTAVEMSNDGSVQLGEAPGTGPAAMALHSVRMGGVRIDPYMARGAVVVEGGSFVFVPSRIVGLLGAAARGSSFLSIFPLSTIPMIARLRARLKAELTRRDHSMPKLRVPRD